MSTNSNIIISQCAARLVLGDQNIDLYHSHFAPTFFLNVSDEAEQELVTELVKSIVRELQQIKGDSGVRAKLLL